MNIRPAHQGDLQQLVDLEQMHLNDELNAGAQMSLDGQAFGKAELKQLIDQHWICVAESDDTTPSEIVGYVLAGTWSFFETWPVYRNIINKLHQFSLDNTQLTKKNSCQYGPIWIKQEYRGQGLFQLLVNGIKKQVNPEYRYMVTFIAEDNMASFSAHTNKASMQVLDFFSFDDRDYYLLAASTD